jgi:hypothetical protein
MPASRSSEAVWRDAADCLDERLIQLSFVA